MLNVECSVLNVECGSASAGRALPPSSIQHSTFNIQHLTLLLIVLLTSCIAITPRTQHASPTATVIPNVPTQHWGIEECGAGSLSTVLQHYGDVTTMQSWDATLPKTHGGVLTIDMLIAARKAGFEAQLVTGTPAIIEQELQHGRPVILMLQVVDSPGKHYDFFHYIVLDGIDPASGLIRTQFGDGKGRWTTFDRLEKAWSGGGHAAILIHPGNDGAALRAAVALEDAGKYAKAARAYRVILAQHPDSLLAWTNLGNAEMQLDHRAEAEEAFRKALALDATSRDALNNLAWLLYQSKSYDEAESLARKAVAQNGPDPYIVLDTLARVLAAKGSCNEALSTFRAAIDAVPQARTAARTDLEKAMAEARTSCRQLRRVVSCHLIAPRSVGWAPQTAAPDSLSC
jgi:tetratricopeptide (TPR) repeat protein